MEKYPWANITNNEKRNKNLSVVCYVLCAGGVHTVINQKGPCVPTACSLIQVGGDGEQVNDLLQRGILHPVMGPFVGFPDTLHVPLQCVFQSGLCPLWGHGFSLLISVVSLFPHLVPSLGYSPVSGEKG